MLFDYFIMTKIFIKHFSIEKPEGSPHFFSAQVIKILSAIASLQLFALAL